MMLCVCTTEAVIGKHTFLASNTLVNKITQLGTAQTKLPLR
jgi:hypothetical protein